MELISIYLVSIINVLTAIRFVYLIRKHKIQPALAMWLFFLLAIATSLVTYIRDGGSGPAGNILNATDLVLAVSVVIAILLYGDKSSRFSKFDLGCLILVIIIMVFWLATGAHFMTNILLQAILVIAYFPVVERMIRLKKNTETFTGWTGMLLAAIISLFSVEGTLAYIYSVRAIVCISLLMGLMLWFTVRKNPETMDK